MELKMKSMVALTIGLIAVGASAQSEPKASTGGGVAGPQMSMPSIQAGHVFMPDSSKPAPAGFAHTHYVLRSTDGNKPKGSLSPSPDLLAGPDTSTVQEAETPCSLGHLYLNDPSTACAEGFGTTGGPSAAGNGAIALVDAYDNPNAASDLATFDSHFGLKAANFTKVYANGNGSCTTPPVNSGWALEESLDIEWAHVFAPNAAIVLVEACSNSFTDLLYAEQVAFQYIIANHSSGGQVSNSWGGGEFSTELSDDSIFQDNSYNASGGYATHVLAFASTGDDGYGVEFPSSSPWVVAAGGSSILRYASTNGFYGENCWSGAGGGVSAYETYATTYTGGNSGPWADFQYPIFGEANRAVPDLAFDADPASGVYVYSQTYGGWYVVGGTSVASPSLAGIVNRSANRLSSIELNGATGNNGFYANAENNLLYSQLGTYTAYSANFYDPKGGSNGVHATAGWDYCTGVGTPRKLLGK
jgi:kumamolisin